MDRVLDDLRQFIPLVRAAVHGAGSAAGAEAGAEAAAGRAVLELVRESVRALARLPELTQVLTPGRYLCHVEPEDGFAVLLFVWHPGDSTPVHNHGTWGVEAVLRGALTVAGFRLAPDGTRPVAVPGAVLRAGAGDVLGVGAGRDEFHQVSNRTETVAVSLHLYGRLLPANLSFTDGEGLVRRELPWEPLPGGGGAPWP